MKRLVLFLIALAAAAPGFAQTQRGIHAAQE